MADLDTIREIVAHVGQYHGHPLPPEALTTYTETFAHTSPELLTDAVQRWCATHAPTASLPSPADLRACCRAVMALRRGETPRTPPPPIDVAATYGNRESIATATAALVARTQLPVGHADRIASDAMPAELRRLHALYPMAGFWDAAAELEAQLARDAKGRANSAGLHARLGRRDATEDAA